MRESQTNAEGTRILLLDDDEGLRARIRDLLDETIADLDLTEVANHVGFFRALQQGRFDLVITGQRLHWSTGSEVLSAVKSLDLTIKVIMLADADGEAEAREELKSGLYSYVLRSDDLRHSLLPPIRSALQIAEHQEQTAVDEEHLREVLEQLGVATFRARPDGSIIDCSESFLRLMAIDVDDDPFEDDAMTAFNRLREATGTQPTLSEEGQVRRLVKPIRTTSGESIWLFLKELCMRTEQGDFIIHGLVEDISDIREREGDASRTQHQEPPIFEPAADPDSADEPQLTGKQPELPLLPLMAVVDRSLAGYELDLDVVTDRRAAVERFCQQLAEWREALPDSRFRFLVSGFGLTEEQDILALKSIARMVEQGILDPLSLILSFDISRLDSASLDETEVLDHLADWGINLCMDSFSTHGVDRLGARRVAFVAARIDFGALGGEGTGHEAWPVLRELSSMAQRLGLEIFARGIGHEAQLSCMRETKCTVYGGELSGDAVSALEATAQLWSSSHG